MKTGIKFMCRNSKSIFLPLVAVLFSSFVYAEDHIYPNGAFYNGGMVNGIRNGMGGLRTNDGTLTIGNWVGDRCDGIMLITEKNGNQYYSICKDGREVYKTAINASQFPGFPKNKNKLGWYMYGYSGHSDISFYEAASVKKSGSIVTYWALQDSIDPVNVKGEYFLSNIAKMQLDCSAARKTSPSNSLLEYFETAARLQIPVQ